MTFTTNALFTLNGGWMQELIILFDCGSPFPTGDCVEEDNPVFDTPASISWHLHPVFKKK